MDEFFEKAPVKEVYFKLALPVVFSMIIGMVYSLADTYFVAKTGNTNLVAGITVGAPLFTFMIAVGDIFGLGGSALISRLFGAKEYAKSRQVSAFSFYSAIVVSLVLTAILLMLQNPMLQLLGAKSDTLPYARAFYQMLVLGSVFITVSLVPSNMVRTEGLAMESMLATLAGTILMIILDPVFLFIFKWGSFGVALANVLGYAVNTGILVYVTVKKSRYLTLNPKEAKVKPDEIKAILAIGIPASVTNFMQTFSMALLNNALVIYGTDKVAAMGITQKVYSIVVLVLVGFAFGAQPLIGYNYGAKNAPRFHEVLRYDFKVEVVYALIASVILMTLASPVVKLFMNNAQIIADGSYMLRACLITTPFIGAILVFTTVFQSAGMGLPALAMALLRQGVAYLAAMFVMQRLFGYHGVVLAQPVADFITFMLGMLIYRHNFKDFR